MIIARIFEIDYQASYYFAHLINKQTKLRTVLLLYSHTGSAIFWTVISILGILFLPSKRAEFISLFLVTLVMMGIIYVIKHSIKRPRPDFKDTRFGSVIFDEYSFPSGHGTRAAYHFILLPLYFPSLTLFWYLWTISMVIVRILIGVHYISDILGGIVISLFLVWLGFVLGVLPIISIF